MGAPRSPRWAAYALGPLLVGAVLLMHGIDASPVATSAPATEHHHADAGSHDHGGDCDCPDAHHLLAACVAVAVTIGAGRFVRRHAQGTGLSWSRVSRPILATGRCRLREVARPPDPAWVRLGVMRC